MRSRRIRKCILIATLGTLGTLTSLASPAADLLEVYKLAQENDSQWSAEERKREGNEQVLVIGKAGLLPMVSAGISGGTTKTTLGADTDPDDCGLSPLFGSLDGIDFDANDDGVTDIQELFSLAAAGSNVYNNIDETFQDVVRSCFQSSKTSKTRYSISLSQPLFRLDRWYDYRLAKTAFNKGEVEYQRAKQDLILRAADAYFNFLRAKEEYEFARNEARAIAYQLKTTKKRYNQGLTSSLNVFEVQAIYDLSQAALIASEAAYDSAYEDILTLTDADDLDISPLPKEVLVEDPTPTSSKKWVDFSRRYNSEIQLAEIALMAAKQDHQKRQIAHAPTIDFLASYSREETGSGASPIATDSTEVTSYGISMNIPIYSGGGITGARNQAKMREFETEDLLNKAYKDVGNTTRKLLRTVKTDVRRVKAQEVAIKSNEAALNAITRGFNNGARTVAELLAAQRDLYQARKTHANAKYDYVLNTLRLKRVTGTLTDQDLTILNNWLTEPSQPSIAEKAKKEGKRREDGPKSLFEALKNL